MRLPVCFSILAVVLMALSALSSYGSAGAPADTATQGANVHISDKSADVVVQVDGLGAFDKVSGIAAAKGAHIGVSSGSAGILTLKASDVNDALLKEIAAVPGVLDIASEMKARTLYTPNDPSSNWQWGLQAIDAYAAWDITTGSRTVVVGELDTGIDWNHPDLTANMWNDSQGYHGYNFINDNHIPMDDNINSYDDAGTWIASTYTYHGTHVAGVIGAVINNGIGVAGMAQVQLMAVKVMNDSGEGTDVTVALGLNWAVDHGADIVTMSLGVDGMSTVLQNAVTYASEHGVVMVAASGNSGDSHVSFPASYPQVIAVGAVDESNRRASFSNWGPGLELMAPGVLIYSTKGDSGYQPLSGTSTAAPSVAGVVGLMLSVNPALTPVRIREVLNSTATDLSTTGYDTSTGWGVVNAFRAVEDVSGPTVTITRHPEYVVPNGTFSITWIVSGSMPGMPGVINETHLLLGESATTMVPYNYTSSGMTWATFVVPGLPSLPKNGTLFLEAVATVDGIVYRSSILSLPVHKAVSSNPFTQFVNDLKDFINNDLGIFNFALLMLVLIAIPIIVIAARSRRPPVFVKVQPGFQPPMTLQSSAPIRYLPPPPPPPPRFEAHVDIISHEVTPSVLKVAEGTKIVWVNRSWAPPPGISIKSGKLDDAGEHPDGAFQSGLLIAPGDYWSATFHRAGTYEYYLTGIWRAGKVVVEPYEQQLEPSVANT